MIHIELVTGKNIRVKGILHDVAKATEPILRLTMVTSERVSHDDYESVEQEIFLHEDKIVYMYEIT
tara:strand:+ start:526 stop:723 length:198 start_codon:yes stop_codon:yes gene_type:complete